MSLARITRQAARSLRPAGHADLAIRAPSRPVTLAAGASPAHPFSTSPARPKKRKPDAPSSKSSSSAAAASHPPPGGGKGKPDTAAAAPADDAFDPLDLDPVSAAFAEVDAHFRAQIQSVLHGGRFSPDQLGALAVTVKPDHGTGGGEPQVFPLRELAQVVPRGGGRTVSLLVTDAAYVKPIMSAVQASPELNQQPQHAPDGAGLELLLRVERERPEERARRVREAARGWRERVRQARARHDRLLKEARRRGALLPDALRRVEREVQKLQDAKMREIDGVEAQAVKQVGGN